ncbi:DsbA family oxidoreductase [Falsiroseomonas tokyonensis]|uniref:DsbA family oxidoreductase n=1 Tax=Falsiroseomonas tokyonensis TaxID=430521 RepID=A0ABV7BX54_9PROT|nr:DsbA family oxidoreductase [Falsiroseomonas tokyonensis]MBU8538631.1 DsbA family oxidoreductase [Falsiroseomonas tokyonensis]
MTTLRNLDVISDSVCPWCWIGKRNLDEALAMLAEEGLRFNLRWRPFQLNPDMPAEGVPRAAYRAQKFGSEARGRELDANVAEAGRNVGLTFRHDLMERTPNSVASHRVVRMAHGQGLQDAVLEAFFRGYFQEGRDVGDPATLVELAAAAGMDGAAVATMLAGDEYREAVLAEDAAARSGGISGVPSFLLDRHLLFSGALPASRMADAFRRADAILSERASAA